MAMKFFFADNLDFIDPDYDFIRDETSPDRMVQRSDIYPHEYFDTPPYDGMLVSRAIVGDERWKGRYSTSQSMRFKRDGVRQFLRYYPNKGQLAPIMGDCGAFSYVKEEVPPYTVPEMVDYYAECGFTHGVSIDHVILGYTEQPHMEGYMPEKWTARYKITLELAREFIEYCYRQGNPFQPIGVAQGWSPQSYRDAVIQLIDMGYNYVALGGMVPLTIPQIHHVLEAVYEVLPASIKLHIFGFTKANNLSEFAKYQIESFDSTSPMIRAFKDPKRSYLLHDKWYSSIRVPDADESRLLKRDILAGIKQQKKLRELERTALNSLRKYAQNAIGIDEALETVVEYVSDFTKIVPVKEYRATLVDRPWESCPCRICKESGIEVIVFRGSNRNRRRGFHNLWQFYQQLEKVRDSKLNIK